MKRKTVLAGNDASAFSTMKLPCIKAHFVHLNTSGQVRVSGSAKSIKTKFLIFQGPGIRLTLTAKLKSVTWTKLHLTNNLLHMWGSAMNSSKCTDRTGVIFTGNSYQCSRCEAIGESSFQCKSPENTCTCIPGTTRLNRSPGQWLRLALLATIAAAFLLSTPMVAVSQLNPELKEALDYHKAGKLKEAVEVYTEAITKNPKSPEAYNWRGMAYEDQGDLAKALADFDKALELSNNYGDAYNNRGEVYRKQNKLVEAMNDYRRATELEKNFAEPHYNMALIFEAQKKNDQAVRELDIYLKLKPDAPDKQQLADKIEMLKKTAVAAAPAAPAPGAPPTAAPAAPGAPKPPEAKPAAKPEDKPAVPRPPGPRPGAVQIKPPAPPVFDLGIPGVPPIPITPDVFEGFDVISGIISLLFYLFPAAMIFLIARKTNTSLPWLAFIPIAQVFLLLNIARKPIWWLILFLAPILAIPLAFAGSVDPTGGIIVGVLTLILVLVPLAAWLFVCTAMAAERGKSVIWGILTFIPCTTFIGLGYLGLSK
ncbi:MAG: tetratricopeptide repeat protein [Desulfomonile tiedjei]|uniref:Tetratricopeptide repeat protein n=1 Tax=Desulfomonile tiedjei TaxID=2358 RepID=A0A9D6Z501_9BACT|nr:tetratricopeptide repeat protein [Desulfomonile tiedjei]